MSTQLERAMNAALTGTIRNSSGKPHTIGQHVTIVKRSETLGREMFLVQFPDDSRGYVFPYEIALVE